MVHLDFKVKKDILGRMETTLFGGGIDRASSCPEIEACSYVNKGEGVLDRYKSNNRCCHRNYGDVFIMKKIINENLN